MIYDNVADKVEELCQRFIEEGNSDKALKVAIKLSKLNELVDKKFPITEQSLHALLNGDERYFQIRDTYRETLYELIIKPYEALLN